MEEAKEYEKLVASCRCNKPIAIDNNAPAVIYEYVVPAIENCKMFASITVWITSDEASANNDEDATDIAVYLNNCFKIAWRPWKKQVVGHRTQFVVYAGEKITFIAANGRKVNMAVPELEILIFRKYTDDDNLTDEDYIEVD